METNNAMLSAPAPIVIRKIPKKPFKVRYIKDMKKNWIMYLLFLPVLAYFVVLHYIPMIGIVVAFEKYSVTKGIFGSRWVGFENFETLFTGDTFLLVMRNTSAMALMNLTVGFFAPVIFALLLSQVKFKKFKRTVQTISYLPYFVAAVVVAQLVTEFLSSEGAVTQLLMWLGLPQQNWLANPKVPVFWLINTFTDIWQGCGYGAIVYIAAISNVNPNLHEAAAMDGANRWQRLVHVTLPTIMPLVVMMLTLRIGLVFVVGFDKILLLYKPITYETADCLATYTYRMAFGSYVDYGVASASGLFQSVVGTTLLIISNALNRKITKSALF